MTRLDDLSNADLKTAQSDLLEAAKRHDGAASRDDFGEELRALYRRKADVARRTADVLDGELLERARKAQGGEA